MILEGDVKGDHATILATLEKILDRFYQALAHVWRLSNAEMFLQFSLFAPCIR